MAPAVKENSQVLDLLHSIDQRIRRLESVLVDDQIDEADEDLYRPEVIKLIKARARQAHKEFKEGKTITLGELERELGP